jgi:hypothetical protein
MKMDGKFGPLFPIGRLLATPAALALKIDFLPYIRRHICGDWGVVSEEDWEANEAALEQGLRLLSVYSEGGKKFWIITEADRSATTVLMPEDY